MAAFSVHTLVLGCIFLGACSTLNLPTLRLGEPSAEQRKTEPQQANPLAYFVGVEGLEIYGQPRASSTPLARLPLHQKVFRDRIEKGYAHVEVEGTNLVGWVDNAKLIWRLPAPSTAATPETERQIVEPPSTSETEKQAPEPRPEAQPTPSLPQAESPAGEADKPVSPSIFNPF